VGAKMSLIIQYHQKTKDFQRLLFYDNNKSEIIESHGSNALESLVYGAKKNHGTPFEHLPHCYEEFENGGASLIYALTKLDLESKLK
jgi:hypothetical protein